MRYLRFMVTRHNAISAAWAVTTVAWAVTSDSWVSTTLAVLNVIVAIAALFVSGRVAYWTWRTDQATARMEVAVAEGERIDAQLDELRARNDQLTQSLCDLQAANSRPRPFTGRTHDVVRMRWQMHGNLVAHHTDDDNRVDTIAVDTATVVTDWFDAHDNPTCEPFPVVLDEPWNLLPMHHDGIWDSSIVMTLAGWLDDGTDVTVTIDVVDLAGIEHLEDFTVSDGRTRLHWQRVRPQT